MPIPDPDKIWPKLDELGTDEVRKKLAMGVYAKYKVPVIEEWLRRKEKEIENKESNDMAQPTPPDNQRQPLIFISYDTRDLEIVKTIDGILKRIFGDGIKTFIAKRDIKAGDDAFKTMLHDNLANSSVVLAICTERSITSPWLWFESGAGFGSSRLIPIWVGITPQEFREPMKIFQGKDIENIEELKELMMRIAEICGIGCENVSISSDEINDLKKLLSSLKSTKNEGEESKKDIIELPLPSAQVFRDREAEVKPITFTMEASFGLTYNVPRQRLLDLLSRSRIRINDSGFLYPLFNEPSVKNDKLLLNIFEEVPHTKEVNQVAVFAYNNLTISQILRHFRWGFDKQRFLDAELINYQAIKFYVFALRVARNLRVPELNINIRLSCLQDCFVKTDSILAGGHFYFAPASNEIELKQNIAVGQNDYERELLQDLLMQVWDKFTSSSGSFPKFIEKEYLRIYDELVSLNRNK